MKICGIIFGLNQKLNKLSLKLLNGYQIGQKKKNEVLIKNKQ